MEASLKFNNEQDLRDALNGRRYKMAINEIDDQLRSMVKYNNDPEGLKSEYWDDELYVKPQDVREFIGKIVRDYIGNDDE
jgi:hypothetical protein